MAAVATRCPARRLWPLAVAASRWSPLPPASDALGHCAGSCRQGRQARWLQRAAHSAAAVAGAAAATSAAAFARCEQRGSGGGAASDVDVGSVLRELWGSISCATTSVVLGDGNVSVDRLMDSLREQADEWKAPGGRVWLSPGETTKLVNSIVTELDMIGSILREHFGNLDLTVHPLALRYLLLGRSQMRTPAWKEAQLVTALGPDADLTGDYHLFSELFDHGGLADAVYEGTEEKVRASVSKVWEGLQWTIPVLVPEAEPGRPAHFIAVLLPDTTKGMRKGRVVFAIRGTKEIADVLTDALMDTAPFQGGVAHRGVVRSSAALCQRYAERLRDFEAQGYEVVVVGHSLGAATAAAVTIELRKGYGLKSVRCVCFAPPPTVDSKLAQECAPYLMSVVHDDDFIPRLQVASLLAMYRQLLDYDWLTPARAEAGSLVALAPGWLQSRISPGDVLKWVDERLAEHFTRWREANQKEAAKHDAAFHDATNRQHMLHVPGFVLHLVRTGATGYRAARTTPQQLYGLELSTTMVDDHFLSGYLAALHAMGPAALAQDGRRARESLSAVLPNAPQEVQQAVDAAVKGVHKVKSKVRQLVQQRPDTS